MSDYAALILGLACAGFGGELFVSGVVRLAQRIRIAPGIIGATVAAFATSSPELSVSISAALEQHPKIALGDALGSNVVNVALILGLTLSLSGIRQTHEAGRRDFPVALAAPLLAAVLLFDGVLSRLDSLLLLALFGAWLATSLHAAWTQRPAAGGGAHESTAPGWRIALSGGLGLLALFAAGILIVQGARGIALSLGLDEFVVAASIVAVGTSVPELATAIVAKWRGHDAVGLGTVLGSNIFNGLFIIAISALIHPIAAAWNDAALALAFGAAAVLAAHPGRSGYLGRGRGALLLLLYGAYLASLLTLDTR
jgi:cation:H+ antiporter